jgi:hypothetical protein
MHWNTGDPRKRSADNEYSANRADDGAGVSAETPLSARAGGHDGEATQPHRAGAPRDLASRRGEDEGGALAGGGVAHGDPGAGRSRLAHEDARAGRRMASPVHRPQRVKVAGVWYSKESGRWRAEDTGLLVSPELGALAPSPRPDYERAREALDTLVFEAGRLRFLVDRRAPDPGRIEDARCDLADAAETTYRVLTELLEDLRGSARSGGRP